MQKYTNILTRLFFFFFVKKIKHQHYAFLLIILVKVTASGCQISDTSYTYFYTESGQHNITHQREKERKREIICSFVGLLLLFSKEIK